MSAAQIFAWTRANLFDGWFNTLLTVLAVWVLIEIVPPLFAWLVTDSVIAADAGPKECKAASGACWAFVREKYRLILFGTFPFDQQWRPIAAIALFITLLAVSTRCHPWGPKLGLAWALALVSIGILMSGGVLGLEAVPNTSWGGLPLTLILSVIGIVVAFPLSILLALGRRSSMPGIRILCVGYIELIRGVPLVSILFMASVMFPLFLPPEVSIDKLVRAQVAFIMFIAAYLAEVVRGGLQAIPVGQYEAAYTLGLGYWRTMIKVILPQALRIAIPPIVNTFIGAFKDTSLVVIIGLLDLLNTTRAAFADPEWRSYYIEAYLVSAAIYFAFCFFMSRYSQYLEKDLARRGPA